MVKVTVMSKRDREAYDRLADYMREHYDLDTMDKRALQKVIETFDYQPNTDVGMNRLLDALEQRLGDEMKSIVRPGVKMGGVVSRLTLPAHLHMTRTERRGKLGDYVVYRDTKTGRFIKHTTALRRLRHASVRVRDAVRATGKAKVV